MSIEALEERLTAVETKLQQLEQANGQEKSEEPRGWQRIVGRFADNPLFEDAVAAGKKWRESEDLKDAEVIS